VNLKLKSSGKLKIFDLTISIVFLTILSLAIWSWIQRPKEVIYDIQITKIRYIYPKLYITWQSNVDLPYPIKRIEVFQRCKLLMIYSELGSLNRIPLMKGDSAMISLTLEKSSNTLLSLTFRLVFDKTYQDFKVEV